MVLRGSIPVINNMEQTGQFSLSISFHIVNNIARTKSPVLWVFCVLIPFILVFQQTAEVSIFL